MDEKERVGEEYWHKIEPKFRQWAFGVYFRKTFKEERNAELRFLKALAASTRPIRNRSLVLWWYRHNGKITDADLASLSI